MAARKLTSKLEATNLAVQYGMTFHEARDWPTDEKDAALPAGTVN